MEKIIEGLVFRPKEAVTTFFDDRNRVIVYGITGYSYIQKEFVKASGPIAYDIIKNAVKKSAKLFISEIFSKKEKSVWEFIRILNKMGIGKVEVVELNDNGEGYLKLENSFIGEYYRGQSDRAVCDYVIGLLEGGLEVIFERPFLCKEIYCVGKGDSFCEFETRISKGKVEKIDLKGIKEYKGEKTNKWDLLEFDSEEGTVWEGPNRAAIFNSSCIAMIQQEMEKITGPAAYTIIKNGNKVATNIFVKQLIPTFLGINKLITSFMKKKLVEELLKVPNYQGTIHLVIEEADYKKPYFKFRGYNSFLAENYKNKTNRPVCDFISGMIEGAAEIIYPGKHIICVENKCIATGDNYCEFEVKSSF